MSKDDVICPIRQTGWDGPVTTQKTFQLVNLSINICPRKIVDARLQVYIITVHNVYE